MPSYFTYLFLLAVSYPVSGQTLELKDYTGPECGIKSYISKRDATCGVEAWRTGRGPQCGVSSYNKGSGPVCGETCSSKCKSRNIFRQCTRREETCTYNVCRHSVFGVEAYNSCSHPDFGVQTYKSCSSPSFGISEYNTCKLLKTKEEVKAYIISMKVLIPEYDTLFTLRHAQILAATNLKDDLACLINEYEENPLNSELVLNLKEKYFLYFGELESDSSVVCSEDREEPDFALLEQSCQSEDTSQFQVCEALAMKNRISDWFETKVGETKDLMEDLVARSSSDIEAELADILSQLESSESLTK